ncbi:MAG: cytochrome c biogenesis protein CcdA [Candidatus Kapaibacteriota bacterium]|jgi:thiol:disulfide interchange protein DsbD
MKKLIISILLLVFSLFSINLIAKDKNQHFQWSAIASVQTAKAGEKFSIKLNFDFEKSWYIYDIIEQIGPEGLGPQKTEISIKPEKLIKIAGKIKTPKPKVKYDSAFYIDIRTFSGKFTFEVPVVALQDIDFSKDKVYAEIYVQQCKDNLCLPGMDFKTLVTPEGSKSISQNAIEQFEETNTKTSQLQTKPDETKLIKETQEIKTDTRKEIETAKKSGVLAYLLFAMGAGALALLTPCVFPMIPITVSFFTKRAEKKPGKGLRDSIVYGLGIILTFTALGFLLAVIFGASGIQNFATNPWLNIAIAILFVVFALNLFGAFEFQLPTSWLNALNVKSQGSGIISVLLMGLTFSLTSFTCTVPFVGVALVSAAGGEWFYPIIGMLGFSFVFALPFFFLALFPSAISKMPRSGTWMNNIKVVMGFLEIAAAIKFISNVDLVWGLGIMPRELFLGIWIGVGILITFYILGLFKLPHDSPVESVGTIRILFATFFISISFYLVSGLFGKKLGELDAFLPPPDYEQIISTQAGISLPITTQRGKNEVQEEWLYDYNTAVKIAKDTGKPIFIDFSGFTCTNCRWMEINMFNKPEVKELLSGMVKVRLFTDRRQEPYISNKEMQMRRFNSIELPLYVIQTSDEKVIATSAFTRNVDEFVNFLKKAYN